MNYTPLTHPTPEQLEAFGLGRMNEAEALELESHLAECSQCFSALEGVPADSFVAGLREAVRSRPRTCQVDPKDPAEAETLSEVSGRATVSAAVPPELANHPRYRIYQVLGSGGMGIVYKAEHLLMERPVALKVINRRLIDDPAALERFRRESRNAARLSHPNVVTAYDAEQAGDTHFLVMEYVEGRSLDRVVAESGPLSVMQACDYARQVALGLQHAYERGMIHRDIKPQNLMLTKAPGTPSWGLIKILDFGLARFAQETKQSGPGIDGSASQEQPPCSERMPGRPVSARRPELTLTGAVMGTPDYMAPEQIGNPHAADIRADIYSLGNTLYFLLTGKVPFPEATVLDKLVAQTEKSPRPLAEARVDLPPDLICLLERMTAKDPAQRPPTPAEVAMALAPFTTALGATYLPPEPAESHQPPRQRRLGRTLGAAAFGGGVLLVFLLFAQSEEKQKVVAYMETVYTTCALLGGTLLGLQFLMSLFGLGHHDVGGGEVHDVGGADGHLGDGDHDVTHEAQVSLFAGILTFRTLVAAVTFFGLAGMAAIAADATPFGSLSLALGAGAAALFGVGFLMRSLYRLKAEGTVQIRRAVGQPATVYLPIPGRKTGAGKVHMNLQNRTMEYQAVTAQEPLPAGVNVIVVGLISSDTVDVVLAPSSERNTNV
jgi:serine/threonine protein kinase